jgi:formylglycine-generating enzyme required for sulfatase activity
MIRIWLAIVPLLCSGIASGQVGIFADGFELGDTSSWYRDTLTVTLPGDVALDFVRIPAGTFWMGSPTDPKERGQEWDESLLQVTLTYDYYMGKYEVTQDQWQAVGFTNPSYFSGCGGCPVETVNWYEAAAYANEVSEDEGVQKCYTLSGCTGNPGEDMECTSANVVASCTGYRLSTEAEWERAARAETQTRFSHGDVLECADDASGCSEMCSGHDPYMLYCGNESDSTEEVGSRLPNGYGLYNMHGGVSEWIQDWHDVYPVGPVVDPTGPSSGNGRGIRGCGWRNIALLCRSANRGFAGGGPGIRGDVNGFRLVKKAD